MGSSASSGLLPHPQVDTSFGRVEGKRVLMPGGRSIANVFLGIPFAKPPTKELRFSKPEMPDRWKGSLICRRYKRRAVQTRTVWDLADVGRVDEDSLYLNIVGPASFNDKYPNGYPVLVYIHGGGFQMDCAAKYHYSNLIRLYCKRDVMVATIEYRLGYLGYFCLDNKHCKGNFGLWDQVFALRFIHDNIRLFCGDPDQVTLCGQSAGGVSTSLLSVSPISRDLFKQTICMSGFAHSAWAVNDRKFAIESSRKKALRLGFKRLCQGEEWTDEENQKCVEYLRKLPSRKFSMTMLGERGMLKSMRLRVAPVLDNELLPGSLKELIEKAPDRNEIVGVTSHEGLIFLALLAPIGGNRKIIMSLIEAAYSTIEYWANERGVDMPITIESYKDLYGVNEMMLTDRKRVRQTLVHMVGDFASNCNPMITTMLNPYFPIMAATHGAELPYIFNVNIYISPWYKTKGDRIVQETMTKMISNFCKFGDPNGDPNGDSGTTNDFTFNWHPISFEHPERHLVIKANCTMKDKLDNTRIERLSPALDLLML